MELIVLLVLKKHQSLGKVEKYGIKMENVFLLALEILLFMIKLIIIV